MIIQCWTFLLNQLCYSHLSQKKKKKKKKKEKEKENYTTHMWIFQNSFGLLFLTWESRNQKNNLAVKREREKRVKEMEK